MQGMQERRKRAVASSWENKEKRVLYNTSGKTRTRSCYTHKDDDDDEKNKNKKKLTGHCLAGVIRGDFVGELCGQQMHHALGGWVGGSVKRLGCCKIAHFHFTQPLNLKHYTLQRTPAHTER
jgi:predicted RNA-binding protein YlxR (DUF448 family)